MVEMLGVLAIIGVLSVGGIAGYSKAMNKYKINKTTDQVSMLVANIRTLFSTQGNYDGLGNGQAVKFGIVPNDMYNASSLTDGSYAQKASFGLNNAFGGQVYITPAPLSKNEDTDKGAFIIAYTNLSTEACVTLVTGDWNSGQGSGLVGITAYDGGETPSYDNAGGENLKKFVVGEASDDVGSPDAHGGNSGTPTPVAVAKAIEWCNVDHPAVAWKYY